MKKNYIVLSGLFLILSFTLFLGNCSAMRKAKPSILFYNISEAETKAIREAVADKIDAVNHPFQFKEFKGENLSKFLNENPDILFDVIFIDGLHLAEQVDRDISNSLKVLKEDGFIVLHDCNPPTEWHAREMYAFYHTPAQGQWNGTTWKAFLKYRNDNSIYSCCIFCEKRYGSSNSSRS